MSIAFINKNSYLTIEIQLIKFFLKEYTNKLAFKKQAASTLCFSKAACFLVENYEEAFILFDY